MDRISNFFRKKDSSPSPAPPDPTDKWLHQIDVLEKAISSMYSIIKPATDIAAVKSPSPSANNSFTSLSMVLTPTKSASSSSSQPQLARVASNNSNHSPDHSTTMCSSEKLKLHLDHLMSEAAEGGENKNSSSSSSGENDDNTTTMAHQTRELALQLIRDFNTVKSRVEACLENLESLDHTSANLRSQVENIKLAFNDARQLEAAKHELAAANRTNEGLQFESETARQTIIELMQKIGKLTPNRAAALKVQQEAEESAKKAAAEEIARQRALEAEEKKKREEEERLRKRFIEASCQVSFPPKVSSASSPTTVATPVSAASPKGSSDQTKPPPASSDAKASTASSASAGAAGNGAGGAGGGANDGGDSASIAHAADYHQQLADMQFVLDETHQALEELRKIQANAEHEREQADTVRNEAHHNELDTLKDVVTTLREEKLRCEEEVREVWERFEKYQEEHTAEYHQLEKDHAAATARAVEEEHIRCEQHCAEKEQQWSQKVHELQRAELSERESTSRVQVEHEESVERSASLLVPHSSALLENRRKECTRLEETICDLERDQRSLSETHNSICRERERLAKELSENTHAMMELQASTQSSPSPSSKSRFSL